VKTIFILLLIFISINISFSQESDSFYVKPKYLASIVNGHLIDSNHYEFDIYLKHTNRNVTVMLFGTCRYWLRINPLYFGGGIITPEIIDSELSPSLRPPSITYATSPTDGGPRLQMPPNLPTSPSTTDTVKWLSSGTLIVRVRLTNTVAFNQSEDIGLRWKNAGSGGHYSGFVVFTDTNNTRLVDITDSTCHINPIATSTNPIIFNSLPTEFNISQNYPNPFNPTTKIEYAIPVVGKVSMNVYDITGREMMNLVNEVKPAGYYSVNFNGANFASGIYFYRIEVLADGVRKYELTRRMALVK